MRWQLSSTSVASAAAAIASLSLISVVRTAIWKHGDESTVAVFLIAANFLCIGALFISCRGLRGRGVRSVATWIAVLLSTLACVAAWSSWETM